MKWGRTRRPAAARVTERSSAPTGAVRGSGRFGLWQSFLGTFFVAAILSVFLLFRQREWHGTGQRAVLVVQELSDNVRRPLTLVVLDPSVPHVTIIPLPRQQYIVPVLETYGTYQTDALIGLNQLENLSWTFLSQSISLQYGVTVDGLLWTHRTDIRTLADVKSVAWSGVLNQTGTTLTYWDRWAWQQALSRVPAYQVQTATSLDWLDGQNRLKEASYDKWAELNVQDNQIRQSKVVVAVQNASGVQGYASRVARMLRLMGYEVRSVDTLKDAVETSIVVRSDLRSDSSVDWAISRLKTNYPYAKIVKSNDLPEKLRSDAVLILGNDQAEKLTRHPRQ